MGGQGDITGASRPSRRLMLASVAVWLILALALPLAALTLNLFRVGGAPLGFWITAQGAIVGLAALALGYAWRAGGAATEEGVQPGLVFAGEAVGAAALLGFTGYIAALGYDALALPLGLVAGLALLAIVVAPRFVLYPVRSIGGFFAIRYGGGSSRRLALLITSVAMVLVLAADLKAGAYALQSLTRIDLSEAIAAVALGVAAIWLLGSILPLKKIAGLGFVAVAIGLLITLVALALHTGGSMLPQLKLGTALENLANLNQTLVVNRLSDVKSLTPMTSPFLLLSMRNFAGLLLAVALGIVAAPHLLGRHVSQATVAPGDAVRRTAYALVAVAVIAVSLPPLAIYSRIGFEQVVAKGIEDAAIPKPFTDASALGWVEVCKQNSSDAAELAAACAKMSGQRGFLRLQDLSFATDGFVVAAPVISGLDPLLQYPLLLGILLAAVLVGNALVAGLVAADAEVRTNAAPKRNGLDIRSAALGAGVFIAAAVLANVETVGSGLLAAEGFAFLAAGMFPPLVLGLHWRHMNATGAVAAMLVGAVIVAAYLIGVHVWPVEFFRISGALSDAAPSAVNRFAVLDAAYNASPDPQAQALAWAALRQHAGTIANWGGLKPAAIVLVAVPLGLVAGILASLLSKEPRAPAPATR
ncbi:MAG TPA: sodium/substrate symporter small subunit [Hyphomicrobium sp.]